MFKRNYIPARQPSADESAEAAHVSAEIKTEIDSMLQGCCRHQTAERGLSKEDVDRLYSMFRDASVDPTERRLPEESKQSSVDITLCTPLFPDAVRGFGGSYFTGIMHCLAAADAHESNTNIKLGYFFPVLTDNTEHEEKG